MSLEVEAFIRTSMEQGKPANLAKSESEFVMNSRGQKLACRSVLPSPASEYKGVVVFLHGYCAHGNRPIQSYMGKSFSEAGYGYLIVDMHGHGYSEGVRGLVESPWDLVDDVLGVLLALYGEGMYSSHSGSDDRLLGQQSTVHLRGMAVSGTQPLFLLGHSMGGAVATLTGLALRSNGSAGSVCPTALARSNEAALARIGTRLGGAVLVAPLVEINAPMAAKPLLEVVSLCCGAAPMPAMLVGSGNKDNDKIWASAVYREYCATDAWPQNKEGLSYGGRIRVSTLVTLMTCSELMLARAQHVSFPFLIMHDPGDAVTRYSGCVKFKQAACTPNADKKLLEMQGGLHDVLANDLEGSVNTILQWLGDHVI